MSQPKPPHLEEDDLLLFANGTLERERVAPVEMHLSFCPSCKAALIEARALLAALAADQASATPGTCSVAADAAADRRLARLPVSIHIN
jgi:anti-sigma factor ChrR (cupin superfamily)